eukprot:GHVN01019700.1.p1 GENE.GHVN01019700.1~~GHVN01019700.1.p1  ORF type:complete len:370 (+),score=27.66 GHVN01019700.1:35-1144(+)
MTECGGGIAHDYTKNSHEGASFPILCETCLGDNPFVRMTCANADKECKICARPFTVFRWQPGRKARFKSTIVCQSCAKLKNVCQTCLFDLEYGLPVQVRDRYLEDHVKLDLPESRVNRDYIAGQMSSQTESLTYGKSANPMLAKLARTTPYYPRNRARICSFWQRGECTRGETCPFRHEASDGDPDLANQNIKNRYTGESDPVAEKIFKRVEQLNALHPPEDKRITTLYLGGLTQDIGENDIRDQFYSFGEIRSIKMIPRQGCAFVTFTSRQAAEEAAEKLHKTLVINDQKIKLLWGRPNTAGPGVGTSTTEQSRTLMTQLGFGALPSDASGPGISSRFAYPSMDPAATGNATLDGSTRDERGPRSKQV